MRPELAAGPDIIEFQSQKINKSNQRKSDVGADQTLYSGEILSLLKMKSIACLTFGSESERAFIHL